MSYLDRHGGAGHGNESGLVRKHRSPGRCVADSSSDALSALASRIDSLPTLPVVVTRVVQTIANPNSTIVDLRKVISPDQSLTATILKVANSAFFGGFRKVDSLEQALKVLGFSEIRNLVLAKAVFNSFKNLKGSGRFDIRKFWEHAFLCGLAAKTLGRFMKKGGNELFVAGLIHDIGKLVIYTALPAEFAKIIEKTGDSISMICISEKDIIGCTHDEVGMNLLDRWMFPNNLVEAVGFHHRPEEAKENPLVSAMVHLADLLAHQMASREDQKEDPSIAEAMFHPGITTLCGVQGIEWNETVCEAVQRELAECRQEEAATLSMFFS